jgi:NAD(P)-dependent dehydrogenase (short-subunit alcohol dehydrogenase family)
MLSGFFASTPIGATKANAAVNVGCHLELTHEYVNRMLAVHTSLRRQRALTMPLVVMTPLRGNPSIRRPGSEGRCSSLPVRLGCVLPPLLPCMQVRGLTPLPPVLMRVGVGTKAFVSHFASSLAAEVRVKGVDVCVVHPSPIQVCLAPEACHMRHRHACVLTEPLLRGCGC